MPTFQYLNTHVEDGVGVLQLNHPEKRNALGWELHHEIIGALAAWAKDDDVATVLIWGTEEYFCAGWRLDVLDGISGDDRRRFTDLALELMEAIYDFPKPTVAAVAGVAPGYGMDVANMCDVTIAAENAHFASTQVRYAMNGFYHGILRKTGGTQRARRMFFTGKPVDAREAHRIGLVDEVVENGTLYQHALAGAKEIAEAGTELLLVLKQVALRAGNMDHIGALAYELAVTQDLTQRALFQERTPAGHAHLKAGTSRAVVGIEGRGA